MYLHQLVLLLLPLLFGLLLFVFAVLQQPD